MPSQRRGWSSPEEAEFARAKDEILVRRFRGGTFAECEAALEQLLQAHLPRHPPIFHEELRRRIEETALDAAAGEQWATFKPCLDRLLRLGFTDNLQRLAACALAAPYLSRCDDAREVVGRFLDDTEDHVRSSPDDSMSAEEATRALARLAGYRSRGTE